MLGSIPWANSFKWSYNFLSFYCFKLFEWRQTTGQKWFLAATSNHRPYSLYYTFLASYKAYDWNHILSFHVIIGRLDIHSYSIRGVLITELWNIVYYVYVCVPNVNTYIFELVFFLFRESTLWSLAEIYKQYLLYIIQIIS